MESIAVFFGILNQCGSECPSLAMVLNISICDFGRDDMQTGVHDDRKLHILVSVVMNVLWKWESFGNLKI